MMNDMNETHISMCRFDAVVDENGNGKCEAIRWDPAWIRGFQKKTPKRSKLGSGVVQSDGQRCHKKGRDVFNKVHILEFRKEDFSFVGCRRSSWRPTHTHTHTHTHRKGRRGKICSSSLTFVAGISVMRQLYRLVFVDSVFARITFVFNMPLLIIQQFPRGSAGRPRAPSLIIIFYQVQIIRNNWQCINCNGWHFCWS